MEKLSFQDNVNLWLDSRRHPFHVAALIILKTPNRAPKNYFRTLAEKHGRFNEIWPVLNKKLKDPESVRNAAWIEEENYRPELHVRHYALPQPGRMKDLMELVSRAHEQLLDRSRPLWEMHIIEGLPRNRFAVYYKIHHALVDGTGGLRLIRSMLKTSPKVHMDFGGVENHKEVKPGRHGAFEKVGDTARGLMKQLRALPEVSFFLSHKGMEALRDQEETIKLPFTAPNTIFNTEVDSSRHIVICDLPLNRIRSLGHRVNGTINDVLLAVYGGALRRYLLNKNALPSKSLVVTMAVSLKRKDQMHGNHVSPVLCPIFTNEGDPLKRLQRIIKVTTRAKSEFGKLSVTANEDLGNLLVRIPLMLFTMSGNTSGVKPLANVVLSNVVGSPETLYLEGSEVESIYPLSVVTDGLSHSLTVASYANKLCFAFTTCPTGQPDIGQMDELLKASYHDLVAAEKDAG